MREEYLHYAFWLLIIGSWVLGVVYGRWGGGSSGALAELGQAVGVPSPVQLGWWHPLVYFTLTVIAVFVLSQLFFGVGAAVFLFVRGVFDGGLILYLENVVGGWTVASISSAELWTVFFVMLVLTVNLPLCLWAAHLGTQRATRMWYRLRGKPVKPTAGAPITNLITVVAASLVAGLVGAFAIAYA